MQAKRKRQQSELDTFVDIVTPENIRFSYRLAGPFVRMFAFLFDLVVIHLMLLGLFSLARISIWYLDIHSDLFERLFMCSCFIIYFLVFWFGLAFLEVVNNGQTFGKAAFQLRVLTTDGLPVSPLQAILRNVIRMADISIGPVTIFIMMSNDRFMRFGDIAAGTIVVFADREEKSREIVHFENRDIKKLAADFPVTFTVSDDLAKVLALYVHRRSALTPQRRLEIATPLARRLMESTGTSPETDPDTFLCALYQWNLEE